jgi:hypothetical protein
MDIQTAKQIRIADYLHSLGYSPIKQQGVNLCTIGKTKREQSKIKM